jgi:acetyl esterase/lipase
MFKRFQISIIIAVLILSHVLTTQARINIWEGTSVRHRVELTPYLVKGNTPAPAVIICPGGSYFWHDMINEGSKVAEWLNANGISAFVLRYRTAYVPAFITHFRLLFRGNRYPDALNDLRQSLRLVRHQAQEYDIDTTKIGVMGFSAGGHLVMSAVELLPRSEWPAFVVPVYPVVSFVDPCVHKRSRRGLLGDSREHNKQLCDSLSLERHVPKDCPPVFLINCKDDPIVNHRNAELLDSALTAKNVPHKFIQYKTGGHGFGASEKKGSAECRQWKAEFIKWFRTLNLDNKD